MRCRRPWWSLALAIATGACDGETPPPRQPEVISDTPDAEVSWRLVWRDEFDAPAGSPVDPQRWTHDVGGDGWGNGQLEHNTDRVENASHDGEGNLVITAIEEDYQGNAYTSARIKTQGLFARTYGRFEARIQLPIGQGIWPAFWMLGEDIESVGWPQCGEIDIMEYRGQRPQESTGALHGPGYSGGQALHGARDAGVNLSDGFHVYAVEWDAQRIAWMVDDDVFFRASRASLPVGTRWVYDHPFFLILNLAVGGSFVGDVGAGTQFPQQMRVDYVRVYEAEE